MSLSSHSPWVCGVWRGDRLAELGMTGVRLIDVGGWIGALVLSFTHWLGQRVRSGSRSLCVVLSLALYMLFFLSLSLRSFSHSLCVLRDPEMI